MRRLLSFLLLLVTISIQAQSFYGRTTGRMPYLNYGLGTDRLGGAKMTHLDSNVLVKVVDSSGTDYKVQLAQQHFAYLPKTFFRRDTGAKPQPHYLTASWRVWGDSLYDWVSIGLPEKLPYRSRQDLHPSRLVVDVFSAVSNSNWITQLKTVTEIKNVWYEQIEDDVFRIFIELKNGQHWGHLIGYRNNNLLVRIKRQPSSLKLKDLRIAVDAGHGGTDNGATGVATKAREKDYTLKIAQALEAQLKKKGATVFMTRSSDTSMAMTDRLLALRNAEPDLLISVHLNSSGNKTVKGTSTYYRHIGFRPLSTAILNRMLELELANFGNIGAFNFSLSGPTEYPNCLVEVAFLSNEEDEKRILDAEFQKEVAKKIRKGVEDWLKGLK